MSFLRFQIRDKRDIKMASSSPAKLTVLISGSGTNLQALIDACASSKLPAQIIRVISNKKDAFGLTRASNASIPTKYHNLLAGKYIAKGEKDEDRRREGREKYDADLARLVMEDKPDLVVCVRTQRNSLGRIYR